MASLFSLSTEEFEGLWILWSSWKIWTSLLGWLEEVTTTSCAWHTEGIIKGEISCSRGHSLAQELLWSILCKLPSSELKKGTPVSYLHFWEKKCNLEWKIASITAGNHENVTQKTGCSNVQGRRVTCFFLYFPFLKVTYDMHILLAAQVRTYPITDIAHKRKLHFLSGTKEGGTDRRLTTSEWLQCSHCYVLFFFQTQGTTNVLTAPRL